MKIDNTLFTAAIGLITLIPAVVSADPVVISPVSQASSKEDDPSSLYISDSLICNNIGCYPKVFEATNEWKELKPAQVLPAGLDIRINIISGIKEAKLGDNIHQGSMNLAPDQEESATVKDLEIIEEPEQRLKDTQGNYEFTNEFSEVRDFLTKAEENQYKLSALDTLALEKKFEDLMEFAHDYKHGYKIIRHEFSLLEGISCNEMLPMPLRELSTRMITSCLRNNPPVSDYINESHPNFKDEIFEQLKKMTNTNPTGAVKVLLKRYLSALDELLPSSYEFSEENLLILKRLLSLKDTQINIEVLELVSKLFCNHTPGTSALEKRDLRETVPDVLEWARELENMLQYEGIDELHTRKFFNSLYNIKLQLKSEVKVGSSFLNWLEEQELARKQSLSDQMETRDLEQDSFDKKLIESRHLIFGNPMADRIKHFDDEL